MQKVIKTLTDDYGNDYLRIGVDAEAEIVYLRWKGKISLDDLKTASLVCLDALKQVKATKMLSDTSELETSWQTLNDWVEHTWTPKALSLGLQWLAIVVSPLFFVKLSAVDLTRRIGDKLELRIFNDASAARRWLAEAHVISRS